MDRPTISRIIGTKRPVKKWTVESFTDNYGVFIIDEMAEACDELLFIQSEVSIAWINALDWFVANAIKELPVMIALLSDMAELPDLDPEYRRKIYRLLARLDSTPNLPPPKIKKQKKKIVRPPIVTLGDLPDEE